LYNLSKTFTFIGLIASLVIFSTAIVVIVLQTLISDEVGAEICIKKIFESITLTITIVIVAIPEGLPMAVSISLAYGFENMFSRDKILVRKLDSIEKMG
jgi:Ca2+-transporting ATPase